ncbi:MAG TPA: ATP-binding protein [Actinomycetota bacterium]|nr:ATP-binding protein [Actinomycetota bacterium]
MGLYIVKNLVEEQGGLVSVSSKVAEGSTFTVRLPKRTEDR